MWLLPGHRAFSLAPQRGHLVEWIPVCLAIGIGTYFAIRFEPTASEWALLSLFGSILLACCRLAHEDYRPFWIGMVFVVAGFALAGLRAHSLAAPVLQYRYYGPIEGRIVKVDRSQSDAARLTLDRVVIARHGRRETPDLVRVSLHHDTAYLDPEPGQVVILTGHLAPPAGPVEPGGYDFQRQAWFARLGAVGYSRTPVLLLEDGTSQGSGLFLHKLRARISGAMRRALPGQSGAFAAAVTTGDRSAMTEEVTESLRASNLSHLLAISGLHMGLLAGFVLSVTRYGLATIRPLALRWDTRKLAAGLSLLAAAGYLALSGGNVATVRAFIMISVMLSAILLGRRAVTLRSVAVAATLILVLSPEALTGPGFQMSFAATVALVTVFGWLSGERWARVPKFAKPALAVVISSMAAGIATAPVAAAHFNRFADYGLVANVLAVLAMGALVIPGAVVAGLMAPIGLSFAGLWMMSVGIWWILRVAAWVSSLPGSQSLIASPPPGTLPLLALGAIWVVLYQGRIRWRALGLIPMVLSIGLWTTATRPDILVSDTGRLVGVLTEGGRSLSKPRGDGFAAQTWLENDGDGATQADAAARPGFWRDGLAQQAQIGYVTIAHVTGRDAADVAAVACESADIVVAPAKVPLGTGTCSLLDGEKLRQGGAVAIFVEGESHRVDTVRQRTGTRIWNSWRPPEAGDTNMVSPVR